MISGLYRVTFEGSDLGDRELAALADAGFSLEDYRSGSRADDPAVVTSQKYFAEVRGRADGPTAAVEAVKGALGEKASAFSNFTAERMIAIGARGGLRPERRAK